MSSREWAVGHSRYRDDRRMYVSPTGTEWGAMPTGRRAGKKWPTSSTAPLRIKTGPHG